MSDEIMLMIGDDGKAALYDDTYDLTIHCESEEEQNEVKKALESIPKWIPVSERLPDLDKYVLCTVNDQGEGNEVVMLCLTMSISTDDYYWIDYAGEYSWELCEVFAWMPLPEPYKGEEQ